MLKRYLCFAWDIYYPSGGWEDFLGDYDTEEDAERVVKAYTAHGFRRGQVVDTQALVHISQTIRQEED